MRVGTSWIDKELYKEFFCQLIALPYYMRDGIELYYNKHDGSWRVDRTTGYVRNFRTMKRNERIRHRTGERIQAV